MTAVDFEKFVEELAHVSGEAILPFFRTMLAAHNKSSGGGFDPVTEADHAAETAMRRLIEQLFPEHGIIGEEFGDRRLRRRICLGARSHRRHQVLHLRPSDLGHADRPLAPGRAGLWLMNQPFTRERFFGDGEAAFWSRHDGAEKRKLTTRRCAALSEATLMTTSPLLIEEERLEPFRRVEKQVRLSRYGGDCYAYCALAAGHVDLVIESGLNPYDIVALIPIVEGAGGVVTTWSGEDASNGGAIVAAGDPRVHEAALKLLGE